MAYFITFTTYGTWLHGRAEGSVDRKNNLHGTSVLPPNPVQELRSQDTLKQAVYELDETRRIIALKTIMEVCTVRKWQLWAAHIRTSHVHIVVTAETEPEKVMTDFKAWVSRRLQEFLSEPKDRKRWTQHGSTRWINSESGLQDVIQYVVDGQGEPMQVYKSVADASGS